MHSTPVETPRTTYAPTSVHLGTPTTHSCRAAEHVGPLALIVSGSYGAGHDSAAREIQARFADVGWRAPIVDVADLFPVGLGRIMRRAYLKQCQVAPGSWGTMMRALDIRDQRSSGTGRHAANACGRLASRRVAAAISPDTRIVVATHPFSCQAIGTLRRRGTIRIPTVSYLTDPSVHSFWINDAIDIHVAVYDEAANEARARGADNVHLIQPLTPRVPPAVGDERRLLRSMLGLPPTAVIALIASGSEGVGDVHRAACDVRDTQAATPVVLCGRNGHLQRTLEGEDGIVTVGWINGLTAIIRGSDCLIQNSGGFTALETLALGTPMISYRCLPGHGTASAAALAREGLAPWPQNVDELRAALITTMARGTASIAQSWAARESFIDALCLPVAPALAS